MKVRFVDTQIWMNEIEDILRDGNEVALNVTGNSMMPFLKNGKDRVLLRPFESQAKKGDILLFKRNNGQYILHRVVKTDGNKLWFAGDIQSLVEGPVDEKNVIAVVSKVRRNGKWIEKGSIEWNFFEKVWIKTVPVRHLIVRAYLSLSKLKHHS